MTPLPDFRHLRGKDPSEATIDILKHQLATQERLGADEQSFAVSWDDSASSGTYTPIRDLKPTAEPAEHVEILHETRDLGELCEFGQ